MMTQTTQQSTEQSGGRSDTSKSEEKDPKIAILGTIFLPGFTEMYLGKVEEGIFWSFLTFLMYVFIIGVLVHVYQIYKSKEKVDSYNEGIDPLYEDLEDLE